jgi:hypothetical protein
MHEDADEKLRAGENQMRLNNTETVWLEQQK